MSRNITAYTPPQAAPAGQVTPYVSVNRDDDGDVILTVRDEAGNQVTSRIPQEVWFRMAREIYQTRSRLAAGQLH